MKIAFLITKSNWGGAQKYVYEIAHSLPRDTFEARVITGGNGPLVSKLEAESIKVLPIEHLGRDVNIRGDIQAFFELWNIVRREKPDVLHINSSKAGIMGALIGRIARVPHIIFTAHGWAFNENRPWYQKIIIKILHWLTIVLSHKTIAVSHAIARAFDGWPRIQGKITTIHLGIQPMTTYARNGARIALTEQFPKLKQMFDDKHTYIVGTVAELHPIKNIDTALYAFRELVEHAPAGQRYAYIVIGEGSDRTRLEALIQSLNLNEHVFLLGHIADAYQYMKAFDTFLLPSKSEALAYVLLEAGLQELPVISTAVGGIPEVVEDMRSGVLVQPNKPHEIAHAINFYIEHPEIARQHAKALRESTLAKFKLEEMTRSTQALYSK